MELEDIENEALELSLEATARLWNSEAERRNAAWSVSDSARTSDEVFRDARKRSL
jgi:hypothetical protein